MIIIIDKARTTEKHFADSTDTAAKLNPSQRFITDHDADISQLIEITIRKKVF